MLKRSFYYSCNVVANQLNQGDEYSNIRRVIAINILDFSFLKDNKYRHSYTFTDVDNPDHRNSLLQSHYLILPNIHHYHQQPSEILKWMHFINDPLSNQAKVYSQEIPAMKLALVRLISWYKDHNSSKALEALDDNAPKYSEAEKREFEQVSQQKKLLKWLPVF